MKIKGNENSVVYVTDGLGNSYMCRVSNISRNFVEVGGYTFDKIYGLQVLAYPLAISPIAYHVPPDKHNGRKITYEDLFGTTERNPD